MPALGSFIDAGGSPIEPWGGSPASASENSGSNNPREDRQTKPPEHLRQIACDDTRSANGGVRKALGGPPPHSRWVGRPREA